MLRVSLGGVAAAVLHLAILGYTVSLILSNHDASWPAYWMIFLALDFPVSLGVMPVTWLVPPSAVGPLGDLTNFWWPLGYHVLVGTAWWYVVGWAIQRRICQRRQADSKEQA